MVALRNDNRPFLPPNFETISFSLPSVEAWESYIAGKSPGWAYLSDGNPSLHELELLLSKLQQQESCWLTSTGKSAMAAALFALLRQGDHIVLLEECYKSTRHFVEGMLSRFGVTHTLIGVDQLDSVSSAVQPGKTKAIIVEAPSNPMTRVPDFAPVFECAKRFDLVTILDNSLSGFHQHGRYPFNLFIHSLSKFASGTGDLMGGAVLGSRTFVSRVKSENGWNSDTMSSATALGIWKGMQTYHLRIARQSSNAQTLAEFLEQQPAVSRVMYPGLPSHPDHCVAKQQMSDFGSVIAFDVSDEQAAKRVLNSLQNFRIAFGTGFTQSIANPAWLFYARSFSEQSEGFSQIRKNTIRLSIGVEPAERLKEDLEQALSQTRIPG